MASNSQAVGLQFQGDVFGGGEIAWRAAGRFLKLLGDGGIDTYALSAIVHLGKLIPISTEQEASVTHLFRNRNGRASFLSKALWLGWGHKDIAEEIAKIRAGASSLALIAAFAAGTSDFEAAQGLEELMSNLGCESDALPIVDVVKPFVSHLSQIMRDFVFEKVLGHVHLQLQMAVDRHKLAFGESDGLSYNYNERGTLPDWAKTVRLLMSASEHGETLSLEIRRVAWFAAFASVILRMSVVVYPDRTVSNPLWQSAGSRGHFVTFLSTQSLHQSVHLSENPVLDDLDVFYHLKLAFDTEVEHIGARFLLHIANESSVRLHCSKTSNEDLMQTLLSCITRETSRFLLFILRLFREIERGRQRRFDPSRYESLEDIPLHASDIQAISKVSEEVGIPSCRVVE